MKWRSVPADFAPWDCVYAFFRRWRNNGLVRELHDRLRGKVREAEGRQAEPTAAIIDSQSVKAAASVPSATRGYDGGKKINGRRRHVITDCLGLILMVLVTAADVTDRQAAGLLLPRLRTRFRKISLVWADGGYAGSLVAWAKEKLQLTLFVKRSDDMAGFVVLPRLWVVERTLGWLLRTRRPARGLRDATRQQRGVHPLLGQHTHGPPPGPHHRRPGRQVAAAGTDDARGMSRPDGTRASQSRSTSASLSTAPPRSSPALRSHLIWLVG
ncbi:IS5 family transposase [Streptomyces sp. NPDC059989]|uniref:IS5 family transposase n=1 Tax=Streptomyces sp. NPDC059989 TaxID=3347026 RepID=UPI0036A0568F